MVHHAVDSRLKEAVIQVGAGGSAGFVEVCIMHPMDLVKTRFQLQVKTAKLDPSYYTGTVLSRVFSQGHTRPELWRYLFLLS